MDLVLLEPVAGGLRVGAEAFRGAPILALAPVRIMLPMLTNVWEIEQAVRLIRQAMQHLQADGIAYDSQIPIGGMIEVPAAALSARAFATRLDFMSLGTNDLVQYTLAIDRVDDEVNYLYDPVHPAVLRLIHEVIASGIAAGIPVSMCGEMAGDPRYVRLLLGLGLRELSMQPRSLLEVAGITPRPCTTMGIKPSAPIAWQSRGLTILLRTRLQPARTDSSSIRTG